MEDLFSQAPAPEPTPKGPVKKEEQPKETLADLAKRILKGKGGADPHSRGDAFEKFRLATLNARNAGVVSEYEPPRPQRPAAKNPVSQRTAPKPPLEERLRNLTEDEIMEINKVSGG